MFEPVPSLSLTTTRPSIQPRWQSDGSSKMHIPLTTLGDNDKLPSSSSHELPYTHTKKQSIFGRLGRAAKIYLGPRFSGWRFSVLSFAVWASIVLLINIAATIAGFTVPSDEKGVFFEGDCVYVKRLNTGLHLAINILSTIILAGSNYTMQCLSAPTRSEIDAAHNRKPAVHLDVGILSIRNLSYISGRRTFLWLLLGLSSLPLHLVYNSAVYGSISTNSYYVFSVDETFITGEQCTNCSNPLPIPVARTLRQPTNDYDTSEVTFTLINLWSKANAHSLEELTPSRCIEEYATSIQSNRRNLLLVSDDDRLPSPTNHYFMNGSHVYWADKFETQDWFTSSKRSLKFEWMCQNLNDKSPPCSDMVENIRNNLENEPWKVGQICYNDDQNCSSSDAPVKRCLSEPAEPRCKIHFEPGIAIVVIVLNLFKAGLMFYIAFRVNDEPLMAMGDAVASFLDKEDVETKNMCLSSMTDFRNGKGYKVGPRQYTGGVYRWKDVTSKLRRCITLIMFLLALAVVSHLLKLGIDNLPAGATLKEFTFGAVDPRATVNYRSTGLISNVLTANTPQIILSLLYYAYNSLFTAMLMGYEWVTYSQHRKGLRVTRQPSGAQRSTYFLQLPYRFGIPLMVLSVTLHWLVSQSIFLVAIELYDVNGDLGVGSSSRRDFKTLSYSPLAIIAVLVLGGLMIISMVAFGYIPYKRGMPLAGTCSLAISAACHPTEQVEGDENIAKKMLQWGVVSIGDDEIGHCAFSADEVGAVVKGKLYGGITAKFGYRDRMAQTNPS